MVVWDVWDFWTINSSTLDCQLELFQARHIKFTAIKDTFFKGSYASSQLIPPVMDMKRVCMLSTTWREQKNTAKQTVYWSNVGSAAGDFGPSFFGGKHSTSPWNLWVSSGPSGIGPIAQVIITNRNCIRILCRLNRLKTAVIRDQLRKNHRLSAEKRWKFCRTFRGGCQGMSSFEGVLRNMHEIAWFNMMTNWNHTKRLEAKKIWKV